MMFTDLDASKYEYNIIFFNKELEEILEKIIACYSLMLADNVRLSNNENKIRDYILYKYLKVPSMKIKLDLANYLFDPELPEDKGRIDIRVMPINPFIEDKAYFILECKRLDSINANGTTGLNAQYINEGMNRFISKKYSAYYRSNGMIGFIVNELDIHKNTQSINSLLIKDYKHITTSQVLTSKIIVKGFDYSYYSTHNSATDTLTIYHLMFDFSKNIIN
ncbi:MAG TPA: hypothetical protein VJY62_17270 [Bacteroidia bacterium]|nr:hypothetical protein [Bacteroidia bacterium]